MEVHVEKFNAIRFAIASTSPRVYTFFDPAGLSDLDKGEIVHSDRAQKPDSHSASR
jgi:hypothetical protein